MGSPAILANIAQIQDPAVQRVVRQIADSIQQIQVALGTLQANASPAQLGQIQKALAAGGSNPLPLTGLPGGAAAVKTLSKITHEFLDSFNATSGSFTQSQPQVSDLVGYATGFGSGAAGTAVTTTLKGAGSGPTTPQTVVQYVELNVGGTLYWIPLVQ